jgi:hypothetical protein
MKLPYAQKAKELAPAGMADPDARLDLLPKGSLRQLPGSLKGFSGGALARFHLGQTYNRLGDSVRGGRFVAAALVQDPKLAVEPLEP